MKKWFVFLHCVTLLLPLPFRSFATAPKVIDDANLLTAAEESALEQKANALSDAYQMDVVILTVWSLDGKSAETYADDYFDSNGYGIGNDHSGILFLLSMEYRDWYMSTCGDTVYAVTDYSIQSIFEEISWYLADGRYYEAFNAYLNQLEYYFNAYTQGDPVDGFKDPYEGPGTYYPGSYDDIVYYDDPVELVFSVKLLISLAIGGAVGGISIMVMRGQMNTAVAQYGAQSYMKQGTYHLYQHQDIFLYQNISRVRRTQSSSGGSRGGSYGGGSRVHRSSSGRRHGGGGGKF